MRNSIIHLATCLVLLLNGALAQEYRATLNGTVTDAQGATIAEARITAIHAGTGSKFAAVSGPSGQYTAPFLAPGLYDITAEAAGFKRYRREGIQLSTNQHVTLDIALEVGAVTESVTITADAPLLTVATASVGQPITEGQMDTMPMMGRAAMALAPLAIGVVDGTNPQFSSRPFDNAGTSKYSIGGGQQSSNELLMDGGPNMSQDRRTAYNPPLDSVQEVKIELFQSDAAYGDTAGGTINIVSKGGSNALHGSAGWYNQVSALAANQFFANSIGAPKKVTRYNQYGISSSGPLVVPKLFNGRNRVFWYFAYEGVKHVQPSSSTLTVPTFAERKGDFSSLLPLGSNYQIYDPRTGVAEGSRVRRQPFAGNLIPASRLNPIALNYMKYYPDPNQAGRNDGQDNYFSYSGSHDDYFTVLTRLDFNLSDKNKVFWRLYRAYRTQYTNKYIDNDASGAIKPRDVEGSTVDDVYVINNRMVLNTRLNWNRFWDVDRRPSDGFDITSLGFPARLAANSPHPVMPGVTFGDATQALGASDGSGFVTPFDAFQFFSALNRVQGKHSLKFGTDGRFKRESSVNWGNSAGNYTFGTNWTRGPLDNSASAPLGQSAASFLLGLPTAGSYDINGSRTNQSSYASVFFQDDWRPSQRLTVNLGLRYEKETGTVERYNRTLAGFDFTSTNRLTAAAKAAYAAGPVAELAAANFNPVGGPIYATPQHRNIYGTSSNGFSPRLGVSWRPMLFRDKTVIRAGFGIFFAPNGTTGVNQPGFSQSTPIVPTQNSYLTPNVTLSNPFPDGLLQPAGASAGINTYLGQSITFFSPDQKWPYNERWTLTIQHRLRGNLVLEAAYIGSRALHLPVSHSLNFIPARFLSTSPVRDNTANNRLTANVANPFQNLLPGTNLNGSTVSVQQLLMAFPQLTGLSVSSLNEGTSDYHALHVRLEKRLSGGLQLLTSFSLSRMMEATGRLNSQDPFLERGVAGENRPYRLSVSGSYELPWGKGKRFAGGAGAWLNRLVGGWTASGIHSLQGGAPLAWGNLLYYGGDLNYDARKIDGAFDTTRFNTVSSQQLVSNIRTFSSQFSNLRADRMNNMQAALIKRIAVRERLKAQLRFEGFNLLNHTMFSPPSLSATSSNFSRITSQANWSRVLQSTLRITW